MIKKDSNHYKAIYIVTIISLLLTASGLHAEERLPVSQALSERTKEFLSDPSRTGSLLGSILAGAAVANPLAPLLGSVAGFMIGKSSAFSNKDGNAARRQAYLNRSLIPGDGVQVTGLTGLTGKPPQASEQTVTTGLSGATGTGNQAEQSEQTVVTGLSMRTAVGQQAEQTEPGVIADLSGAIGTGNQAEQSEQTVISELSMRTAVGEQAEQTEPRVIAVLSGETGTGNQLEQSEQLAIVGGFYGATEAGNQLEPTEQAINADLFGETGMANQSERTEQIVIVGLSGETGMGSNLQQQLTDACSNVQSAEPLSLSCYYYSQ